MSDSLPVVNVDVQPAVLASGSDTLRTGYLRLVWEHWKKVAHSIGVVQTRLLMIAFYFVVALPLGLAMRMSGDKLRLRRPEGSAWVPHHHEDPSLESARRQF